MNRSATLPHSPSPGTPPAKTPRAVATPALHPARGTLSQSAASSPAETEPRTATSSLVVRGDYSVRFSHPGESEAMRAAEAWCKARGFSVGRMQADAPRGILLGDYDIQKWRNLDGQDREDLHGIMDAPGRTWRKGPVAITIRRDAPAAVLEAFRSEPELDAPPAGDDHHPLDRAAQSHVGREEDPMTCGASDLKTTMLIVVLAGVIVALAIACFVQIADKRRDRRREERASHIPERLRNVRRAAPLSPATEDAP